MEFWGVEVKSGEPFLVKPGEGKVLHLSQACLGEAKKDKNESVCIFVNIDDKKLVLGTLSAEKLPQQVFDLVFDREFQLSHNWKNGSVYFYGYKAANPFDESEDEDEDESDSEDDIPLYVENNGRQETQAKQVKPSAPEIANAAKESGAGKQKAKTVEPKKEVKPGKAEDTEDESDSDDPMSEEESDSDEDVESSDDEDDDEDSDEEDETPKKVESNKKRPSESAIKTPGPDKKAKLVTPKKTGTDGKKGGGHVDTPHPSKQAGKTPANKSNQQTPKSEGSHTCKPCNRSFKSENALDSHTKAKHSAGK